MNGINDDSMIIETDSDLLCESSINSNLTIYDDFFYSIDESISSGDISYIQTAIKNYGNKLQPDCIKMASNIMIQILEEKMEDILVTNN